MIIKEDKQLIIYCFRHQRIGINYKIESKKLEIARIILTKVSKEAIYYQNVKGFLKKINKIYEDDKFVKIGINSYGQFTCDDLKFNIIKPYMMVKYRLASKKYSNKIYNNLLKEIKN